MYSSEYGVGPRPPALRGRTRAPARGTVSQLTHESTLWPGRVALRSGCALRSPLSLPLGFLFVD